MAEKYAEQQHPAICGELALNDAAGCVSALMGLVTLSFDLLTLKLVCESHNSITGGNLHSEFGHARPLGSRVIRYVRDGRTDGRKDRWMDKSKVYCPFTQLYSPFEKAAQLYAKKMKVNI